MSVGKFYAEIALKCIMKIVLELSVYSHLQLDKMLDEMNQSSLLSNLYNSVLRICTILHWFKVVFGCWHTIYLVQFWHRNFQWLIWLVCEGSFVCAVTFNKSVVVQIFWVQFRCDRKMMAKSPQWINWQQPNKVTHKMNWDFHLFQLI